jgi:hypothetical protein
MADYYLGHAGRRRGRLGAGIATALSIGILGLLPLQAAHAGTTITVTTTAQEKTVDGNCSLEEAIQAANTDTAVDACPAGSGADTIVLAAGATYTLTSADNSPQTGPDGLPIIASPITIQGNGATITRSSAPGTPKFRIFYQDVGSSLTLSSLTVSNGDSPGFGGAPGSGGAVYSVGTLTITNSTISGNKTEPGGGVDARGGGIFDGIALTMVNSTVSGNTAVGTGGSVGGGIIVRPGGTTTTITSSTFAGNSGNNGADFETEASSLTITDSVMADGCLVEGPVTDGGHNLDVGSSCAFNGATDLRNTNPQLGPLAGNGGPTQTQALLAGSPAIDAGGTCPAADGGVDQRGLPRFSPCDIGAYEVQDQAVVLGTPGSLSAAEGQSVTQTVTFSDGDSPAAGDSTASINWGDGSAPTAGTVTPVSGQPGTFTVSGSHVYGEGGSFTGTVAVTDSDSSGASASFSATIQDFALTASGGITLNGTEGTADTGPVQGTVATFTDADPGEAASHFTATIAWGDGTSSAGTVSGPAGGPFSVSGSHSYAENGTYAVTVSVNDPGGASATATSRAVIADPAGLALVLDILEDLLGG